MVGSGEQQQFLWSKVYHYQANIFLLLFVERRNVYLCLKSGLFSVSWEKLSILHVLFTVLNYKLHAHLCSLYTWYSVVEPSSVPLHTTLQKPSENGQFQSQFGKPSMLRILVRWGLKAYAKERAGQDPSSRPSLVTKHPSSNEEVYFEMMIVVSSFPQNVKKSCLTHTTFVNHFRWVAWQPVLEAQTLKLLLSNLNIWKFLTWRRGLDQKMFIKQDGRHKPECSHVLLR